MTARKALGASLILAGVVAGGALLAWNGLAAQPIAPVALLPRPAR